MLSHLFGGGSSRRAVCTLTGAAGTHPARRREVGRVGSCSRVCPPGRDEGAAGGPGKSPESDRASSGENKTRGSWESCHGVAMRGSVRGASGLSFSLLPSRLCPSEWEPASPGTLRFLLKPDNCSPRILGEAGGEARGRGLESHLGDPNWSLSAGPAGEALGSRLLRVARKRLFYSVHAIRLGPHPIPAVCTPASGWRESCLEQGLFF